MTELKFSLAGHLDRPTSSRYFQPCAVTITVSSGFLKYYNQISLYYDDSFGSTVDKRSTILTIECLGQPLKIYS